jgi:hypothetical protein
MAASGTPVARAVSELIDQYGGRLVLEAVANYCFQHPRSGNPMGVMESISISPSSIG